MSYADQLREMEERAHRSTPREYISNEEYRRLKSALTRAKNSGDGMKLLKTVEAAVAIFNAKVWPDDWNLWRIALDDAAVKARHVDRDYDLSDELHAASMILFP